jgi:uncharacterized repeat protein (TIGR01451 family)
MLSRRVPLLITFSASLLVLSVAARDWRPLVLILPLASLFFLAKTFYPTDELNIEVKKELTAENVLTGETVKTTLEVTNKGKEKINFLEVYDRLPAELALVEGTNHLVLSLDPGENVAFTYETLCAERGKYTIGPVYLRTRDPLGFNFTEDTKQVTSTLYVLPFIEKLNSTDLPFKRTGQWPGLIHSSRKGEGTEFYGIRDYMSSDELRKVEWKASARLGKLMTTEHESDRSTDIVIILDARTGSDAEDSSKILLECGIRAAGSLASLLLNLGNQVSLITYGKERTWLPGGFGKRHFKNILKTLTSVEPGETPLPIDFGLQMVFPSKPQIILISPLLQPNIAKEIRALRHESRNILVISPSSPSTPHDETSETRNIAVRILALERRNVIDEARRYCTAIDWNPSASLRAAIREVRRWNVIARQ